ncbi:MAG TPA: histidine phosphatase family protein [Alphaproteobacteria bacterium]|nr:histidine phosphatase family protein [Alphaproteobacteria bacterium]
MAKTLLLLRHAKSSREDPEMADFDRPLTRRGRRDAPRMGEWMRKAGIKPDLILCSDARRARETWTELAQTLRSTAPVLFERALYMATSRALLHRLQRLAGSIGSVLVIGHNPGLEQTAQALANGTGEALERLQQKFPTAALARLDFAIEDWNKLRPGSGRVALFVVPSDLD